MKDTFTISAFMYGAALFSGFLYLVGFWMPFHLNIFEHIELLDILRVSVLPLVPIVAMTAVSAGAGTFMGIRAAKLDARDEQLSVVRRERNTRRGNWLIAGALTAMLLSGLPDILFGESALVRLKGIFPVASLIAALMLMRERRFLDGVPVAARTVLIGVACLVPSGAMSMGYKNGQSAISNSAEGYYLAASKDCSSSDGERFRYLSVVGGKVFTMSTMDGAICITSADSFRLVRYTPESKGEHQNILREWLDRWPSFGE